MPESPNVNFLFTIACDTEARHMKRGYMGDHSGNTGTQAKESLRYAYAFLIKTLLFVGVISMIMMSESRWLDPVRLFIRRLIGYIESFCMHIV